MPEAPKNLLRNEGGKNNKSPNNSQSLSKYEITPRRQELEGVEELHNRVSPMIAQYLEIKQQHLDCLLFYRMGDFYELFFEDAIIAAEILGITLTKRGKYLGKDIPMCGVPARSADNYIARLIKAEKHIAVCEQVLASSEAKSGDLMHREVVRIITAGTLTEDELLLPQAYNYLLSIHNGAISWADISTGNFFVKAINNINDICAAIAQLSPQEIIIAESYFNVLPFEVRSQIEKIALTKLPDKAFNSATGKKLLSKNFGANSGGKLEDIYCAAGALLNYVQATQKNLSSKLQKPIMENDEEFMIIDAATRSNLELLAPQRKSKKDINLFSVLNQTQTSAGARLLAQRLQAPLRSVDKINNRLDEISFFVGDTQLSEEISKHLKAAPDMIRALSRLSYGRSNPNDLTIIRDGLKMAHTINSLLMENNFSKKPINIKQAAAKLNNVPTKLSDDLEKALAEVIPQNFRDGNVIGGNYDSVLDQLRLYTKETNRIIATLALDYAKQAKIKNLKIKHNNVLGYFIETPAIQGKTLLENPLNKVFIHRQTLSNVLRFSTEKLADLAEKVLEQDAAIAEREKIIIGGLIEAVLNKASEIRDLADGLALLDVATGLAKIVGQYQLTRPQIDESESFDIVGGRHLVVETALNKNSQTFISNDCLLNGRLWLLTGPNMAGKSTFLRQNATIAVMAQAGCFVPAASAHIGIIDRLFSRIGAFDNLALGQSTFMVEMLEVANILTQASIKSFVIVDEIGRGTSTFDGLALAGAILEFMSNNIKCRTLFATHFHELTQLEGKLDNLFNYHMKTSLDNSKTGSKDINLLYQVAAGSSLYSYGIQIAKRAGLPNQVIVRASELLKTFEAQQSNSVK